MVYHQALLLTEELWQYERLRLATRGIIFLGTPLRFGDLPLAQFGRGLLSLLGEIGLKLGSHSAFRSPSYTNQLLLETFKREGKEFEVFLRSTDTAIKVFGFYETQPTVGRGERSDWVISSRHPAPFTSADIASTLRS